MLLVLLFFCIQWSLTSTGILMHNLRSDCQSLTFLNISESQLYWDIKEGCSRDVVEGKEASCFSMLLCFHADTFCIVISRENWSHWAWNLAYLLAAQVQQKHLWTDLLQLLLSTGISRCICFQGASKPRKAASQKVCHLLFRLKKLKRKKKKIKKIAFWHLNKASLFFFPKLL